MQKQLLCCRRKFEAQGRDFVKVKQAFALTESRPYYELNFCIAVNNVKLKVHQNYDVIKSEIKFSNLDPYFLELLKKVI